MAPIEVVIVGNTTDAEQKLGGLGGTLGNLGSIVSGVRDAFDLVAGAISGAIEFGSQFTNAAIESQNAVAELNAVLEATGGAAGLSSQQLQDMATELSQVTAFSDEAVIGAQSMLLTFRNIGEETFPRATAAMLDMGQMFGSVDAAAVQLGKALNDPIAGISALSRIGVTFTEEQKEMIENFMEAGDIMSAQNVILSELEAQIGGVAEAYGQTFGGQLEIFKNRMGEVQETIGNGILPVLETLMEFIMPLVPVIEELGGHIATVFHGLNLGLAEGNWDFFYGALERLDGFVADLFQTIANAIDTWAAGSGPDELSAKIVAWIDSIGTDSTIDSKALIAMGNILAALIRAVGRIDWGAIMDTINERLTEAVGGLENNINTSVDRWAAGIGESIKEGLINGLNAIDIGAQRWVDNHIIIPIKAALGIASPSSVFAEIGRNIVLGLIGGFTSMIGSLVTIVTGIVDAVLAIFQPVLDILGFDTSGSGSTGSHTTGTGTGTGTTTPITGGTVVNQYFAGATINVGSWDEIAYDCIYPNPFVGATSGQLGPPGGGSTSGGGR